jgi:hypothetical protein
MNYYYTVLQSKSHAFMLEHRLRVQQIECEVVYMPRELMKDLCNMSVRFTDKNLNSAIEVIKYSGLPGVKLYKEIVFPNKSQYEEVQL